MRKLTLWEHAQSSRDNQRQSWVQTQAARPVSQPCLSLAACQPGSSTPGFITFSPGEHTWPPLLSEDQPLGKEKPILQREPGLPVLGPGTHPQAKSMGKSESPFTPLQPPQPHMSHATKDSAIHPKPPMDRGGGCPVKTTSFTFSIFLLIK